MYRKILVTLDGSELSECVLPHVEAFREGFPGCEMVLLRVVEPVYDTSTTYVEAISPEQWKARENSLQSAAEKYLKQVADRLGRDGAPVRSVTVIGRVEERIAEYVDREGIDVILMATHGRSGVSRWVMGSVADRVLRTSHVPVLMVRAPGTKKGA